MRICTYNPLASSYSERIEDRSAELRSWDLILLNGTQKKARPDQVEERHNHIRHWSISCGYKKGRLINSSCGLIFLVTRRIRREALYEILRPPAGLQGRIAGIRLKDRSYDFTVLNVYFAAVHDKNHAEIAKKITARLEEQMDMLPARTTIMIGGDINSDIGLYRDGDGM
eukprot:1466422-Pyramimonas_sp.AAC.1